MAICRVKDLLWEARRRKRAVGAFNVGNMEMILGVVSAAEQMNTPIILQIAEKRLRWSPLYLMAPMMVSAAKEARVAVALQLDHGLSETVLRASVAYGFNSVMFDGSAYSLRENIEKTKSVVDWAHTLGLNVEAEIGVVGGSEGGEDRRPVCTDPQEAARFVAESGCDALAVAIGNAHGHYRAAPKLDFEVLKNIRDMVDVPLALHGGSGIAPEDFRRSVDLGISKINIGTATFDALTAGAEDCLCKEGANDYFALNESMAARVCENAKRHMEIFNNQTIGNGGQDGICEI
jgi:fructose-bisphosphate aldolase class II